MNFLLSLHPIPLLLVSVFFKEFHPLVPECLSPRLSELNVTLCASSGPVVSSAEKSLALEIVDYTKLIRRSVAAATSRQSVSESK